MPRTTLDLDAPILRELKRLQRREGKSLGRLASDLLAVALSGEHEKRTTPGFSWIARPMGQPRIDLRDKEALWAALDGGNPVPRSPRVSR